MSDSSISGLLSLPLEVTRKILSHLQPFEVYQKLIEPNSWINLSPIQDLALELIFTKKMVIRRNWTHDWNCLVIGGFEKGYRILYKLISYNLQTSKVMFPREIELIFSFRGEYHTHAYNNRFYREVESFIKLLEILSFDNFKDHQLIVESEKDWTEKEVDGINIDDFNDDKEYRPPLTGNYTLDNGLNSIDGSSSSNVSSPTRSTFRSSTSPTPFISRFIPECTPYTFQLIYPHPPTPTIINYTKKIIQRLENLSQNIVKLLIQCRHSTTELSLNLNILSYPFLSSNLRELYLWNNGVREYTLKQYLKRSPVYLTRLDLTANELSSLEGINLPPTLEEFIISANNIVSLEGPNYSEAVNLKVLDVSVNAITSLDPVRLPPSLATLHLSYNTISTIDIVLPENLKVLNLSQNLLHSIDHIFLPDSLEELYVKENSFKTFETDYFAANYNLKLLDLSENHIDDLDDLGTLPDSLQELILDNNEIDYNDLNNIFTKDLRKLSMISTGLIALNDYKFPQMLRELNLSKNEISEIRDVVFGDTKLSLDLSGNKLTQFNLPPDNLQLACVTSLNLSDNSFLNGFRDICLPFNLTRLFLSDIRLQTLENSLINHLPPTLQVLELNSVLESSMELSVDFTILPKLHHLSLERNNISLINDTQYPPTLTYLSYEHNELTYIPFERIPTNIKFLQFNHNKICKETKLEALPYFPKIEYFGLEGDQTRLMKKRLYFGKQMWSTV